MIKEALATKGCPLVPKPQANGNGEGTEEVKSFGVSCISQRTENRAGKINVFDGVGWGGWGGAAITSFHLRRWMLRCLRL